MDFFVDIFLKGFVQFVVATTVCTTGSVHTVICCTHIFLHIARAQSHSHMFMRVHIHAWLKCLQKGVCMCVIFLYLMFSAVFAVP